MEIYTYEVGDIEKKHWQLEMQNRKTTGNRSVF